MYNTQIKISIKFQSDDDWQMTSLPLQYQYQGYT